jgi:hypothetical protein
MKFLGTVKGQNGLQTTEWEVYGRREIFIQ